MYLCTLKSTKGDLVCVSACSSILQSIPDRRALSSLLISFENLVSTGATTIFLQFQEEIKCFQKSGGNSLYKTTSRSSTHVHCASDTATVESNCSSRIQNLFLVHMIATVEVWNPYATGQNLSWRKFDDIVVA